MGATQASPWTVIKTKASGEVVASVRMLVVGIRNVRVRVPQGRVPMHVAV